MNTHEKEQIYLNLVWKRYYVSVNLFQGFELYSIYVGEVKEKI
jgi:hypothetical protein